MDERLKLIFEQQIEYRQKSGQPAGYLSNTVKYDDVLKHLILAADELKEAREEIPFRFGKVLKNDIVGGVDLINFTRELADTFIFMINAMIIMDIDASMFLSTVEAKQQRNFDRIYNKERFVYNSKDPVIIIDGPDGVGKSTICDELSKHYLAPVIKISKDRNFSFNEDHAHVFHTTINQFEGPMILDRCYPSTLVYSSYFKREYDISYINSMFKDRDVSIFIIDCDEPFRSDDVMPDESFSAIRMKFIELANIHKWKIIRNDGIITNCVMQIIEELRF